eukprot:3138979-Rhodomonas_salina.3
MQIHDTSIGRRIGRSPGNFQRPYGSRSPGSSSLCQYRTSRWNAQQVRRRLPRMMWISPV